MFIPIVWSWDNDNSDLLHVPPLRNVLKIKSQKELPNIFVYNPNSMKVKKFPEPLDDPSKLSPELLVLWAKKAVWSTEIKTLKKRIEEFDDESIEADKRLTLEQKEKAEIHVE